MKTLLQKLTRADIAFYILPLIMLNLVAGTLAQRPMGLYAAQKMFFGSFIYWAGPIPLPGGFLLTGLLTLFLLLKFLLESEWTLRKSGINLAHLGVLVLLGGGLAAALFAREGYMAIPEGASSPYVYDYQKRSLYIFENDRLLHALPFENLASALKAAQLPFSLALKSTCANCAIGKRAESAQDFGTAPMRSLAQFMALDPKPAEKEPEQNLSGLTMEISGLDTAHNGIYIAFEGMPKPIVFKENSREYKIIFGREQRALPFAIKLDNFTQEHHPGTEMARAYSSDIVVQDGGASWPARIEMNKPLRYKGYTFYQSSFEQTPEAEITVLSVVENRGRLFPYLGTALLAAGLLLHLALTVRERRAA